MLHFRSRGEYFKVNEDGYMTQESNNNFSGNWKFLGVSFHHWRRGLDVVFSKAFKHPELLIGGIVWDKDHGTTRQWGGKYNGGIPRITSSWSD